MILNDKVNSPDILLGETLPEPPFAIAREWVRRVLTFLVPFVIAGLDIPFAQKALYIVLWMWAALAFWHLFQVGVQVRDALLQIILFSRLTYVAVHLRNEKEGLPPARDRLKDDLKGESDHQDNWLIQARLRPLRLLLNATYFAIAGVYVALAAALAFALANPDSVSGAIAWVERSLVSAAAIGSE